MPENVTIEDLNYIMEFGTLHGRIDNFICQTSFGGSQQIKIYTSDTYKENAVNTALRIRARAIFSYTMKSWNPQVDDNFRDKLRSIYEDTIYLFYLGQIILKAQYFKIFAPASYTFINRTTQEIIYDGSFGPDQCMIFNEDTETQYCIDCYLGSNKFSSVEIKTVSELFDIKSYYYNLFGL
jgi:hypothetical protein